MGLVFVAGAMSIPVNDFLIDTSINNPKRHMISWLLGDRIVMALFLYRIGLGIII